ncbi:MAG: glycosyltransferase [Cytophagales bacterium]|nr:glycosyltransferase [Cytophagales bacterium]
MKTNKKILLISPARYGYVMNDVEILGKHYEVIFFVYDTKGLITLITNTTRYIINFFYNILSLQAIVVWFADYHGLAPTLMARLFGKKIIIIVGGYDACKVPEYNYGAHIQQWRSKMIKYICSHSTYTLCVSHHTAKELINNTNITPSYRLKVVHNTAMVSSVHDIAQKQDIVICVSKVPDYKTYMIKGVDRFIALAQAMPQVRYVWIGASKFDTAFVAPIPNNLTVIEAVEKDILFTYLANSKVICQLSRVESFGVALLEGMMLGNVPIGMKNTGSSEVINTSFGYVIEEFEVSKVADMVQNALINAPEWSTLNVNYAKEHFGFEKRVEAMIQLIG